MKNNKVIFLDVDGTLIDYEKHLPASAVTAINTARKNGNRIYLCTGCSKFELEKMNLPETDGVIGGNGAYIEENGTFLMHKILTAEETRSIIDWCYDRDLAFYIESNTGVYCNEKMAETWHDTVLKYAMGKQGDKESAEAYCKEFRELLTFSHRENLYKEEANKIDFIMHSYQDHLDSLRDFPSLEASTWGGKDEQALFSDLGPAGITKKHAVDVLLKHLCTDRRDAIAFGDAKIDIPMFQYCGYGVAMGNGGPECRDAADYVTAEVNEDGLLKAFKHLELI